MMELILGAALLTSGSSVDASSLLDCEGSQQIIENIQKTYPASASQLLESPQAGVFRGRGRSPPACSICLSITRRTVEP